jgi:phosphohistidine phosphatase
MKEVILIRHAQAEQPLSIVADFGRNLDPAGIKEAIRLGLFLKEKQAAPDIILYSEATRTADTARQIVVSGEFNPSVMEGHMAFYNSPYPVLISRIRSCTSPGQRLALVGHNPGISHLASLLASSGHYQLATSAAVCLRFEADTWDGIQDGNGSEVWYYQPKN